jgi:peptide/nickel transport system ATP-binding protein
MMTTAEMASEDSSPADSTSDPVFVLDDLWVSFNTESGAVHALRGVSLRVNPGETLALVGESGSGKSTVALAALGLLGSSAEVCGSAIIAGRQTIGADDRELRTLRGAAAGMVFQEPATALDPLMRVGDQIVEVIRNHNNVSADEAERRAIELLEHVGLPDPAARARRLPCELSGGQRQRVVIAMAIANRPRLLIADEPTTALDVTVQAEILDLLRRLAAEHRMGVLLVTHNMGVVADIADRVAVMYRGAIVEDGPVDEVLLRPRHDYTRRLLAAVPRLTVHDVESVPAQSIPDQAGVPDQPEPYVDLRGVTVRFGSGRRAFTALDDVTLQIAPGETLGLVGESGSGKSTVARVVLSLVKPDSGDVRIFGKLLAKTGRRERRRLQGGIGVALQDPVACLDARMSVGECIAEPLRVHAKRIGAAERRRRVAAVLDAVRLPTDYVSRGPRELSGGQRQRVSLARALVLGPRLLVADEPTSALDVSVQQMVLDVISELQRELGFACLFVTHDLAVIQPFANRVAVLRRGRVVEQGATEQTLSHPATAYAQALLAAVPVPDPVVQRARRQARLAATAAAPEPR